MDTPTPSTNPVINPSGESKGSMVGSIIVLIILIIGALYVFSLRSKAPTEPVDTDTATSDDISALEQSADENTAALVGLDADLSVTENDVE